MAKGEDMELQQFNGNCEAGPDAVLLLGSTGTGKSSTINKCTGQSIKIGDGYKPVTTHCDSYPTYENLTWIDTMGFDDPDIDDNETFQDMLRYLHRQNLTKVKAIIWTVHPGTIRQDATLNKQAKLIDMFAEKDIWNNVIIICKQSMNPEYDARGAIQASCNYNNLPKLKVTGYRFLDDPSFTAEQYNLMEENIELRKVSNVLDNKDVRSRVLQKIEEIPTSIQIIFKDYRCRACGVEGDHRLLPLFCHMEKESVHPGGYTKEHTKSTERYHSSKQYVLEHTGKLKKRMFSGGCMGKKQTYHDCCDRDKGDEGCEEMWACCKKPVENEGCGWRYTCCQMDMESDKGKEGCETIYACCQRDLKSEGCKQVCKKCGLEWGSKANECYSTTLNPHDLERVVHSV